MNSTRKPAGRRAGTPATRGQIVSAARRAFTSNGYAKATIRAIAAGAGVDPALVMHYFGTKERLFLEAMRLPIEPAAVIATLLQSDPEHAGERVMGVFFDIWEGDSERQALVALVRSAMTEDLAAEIIRDQVVVPLERALAEAGLDQPGLRAALVATRLMGIALGRYVLRVEALATATRDQLAAAVGPSLQRYLNGDITTTYEGGSP